MARTKGTANLAASLEVLAGAPLDSRTVVPTVADLTVAANFPYKYVGMPVVVQATGDMYILTDNDVTVPANWKKQSGSGGSGGHTIEDNGTAMTARAGLNFTDFDISDDSEDDETDVKAHRLTAEELEDIIYKVPSLANMSQLGTEAMIFSTSEKAVGQWTDGKILYAKTVTGTVPNGSAWFDIAHGISNIDKVCFSKIGMVNGEGAYITIGGADDSYSKLYGMVGKTNIGLCIVPNNDYKGYGIIATIFYTKTTDTALASGEKYAGLTANGEVIYEQEFSTTEITSGNYFTANLSYKDLLDVKGYADLYAGSELNGCLTFPQTILAGAYDGVYANVKSNMAKTAVVVYFKDGRTNPSTAYKLKNVHFTVRYTKTS